jgi:hypothetical protein
MPNGTTAFAHALPCPVAGWAVRNKRRFMMNHAGRLMSSWMGGGVWLWAVVGIVLLVLLVVMIIPPRKK